MFDPLDKHLICKLDIYVCKASVIMIPFPQVEPAKLNVSVFQRGVYVLTAELGTPSCATSPSKLLTPLH